MIDVSRQTRSLLADATVLHHLPPELLDIIRQQSSTKLLDAVSQAALRQPLTERIFAHFESVFPDLCARWILNAPPKAPRTRIFAAFARLLPFAPHLAAYLRHPDHHAPAVGQQAPAMLLLPKFDETTLAALDNVQLTESLITAWRLLNFNLRTYGYLASSAYMQVLFKHPSRAVRYLAIRIFCLLLHAADFKLEALIDEHVGKEEAITGLLDGKSVDMGFLSLHERDRARHLIALRVELSSQISDDNGKTLLQNTTPYAVAYGDNVLARPYGPVGDPSSLVMTETTTRNLEKLAGLLQQDDPILLHGIPGVGKTSLIREVAIQLGMYSNMVTLHLNEQTDAKMLIGLYSTDSKPGSFQWRPGVLTTAVREGRWVLVEDLDRAPTEVLSTLLPLIERKELLIPSRGERIRAASSFRLFATVRTTKGLNGRENLPTLVGMRFWQALYTEPPTQPELEQIVLQTYPVLKKFAPGILAVHSRLVQLNSNTALMSRGRSVMDRQVNLRDLLKWCRRLRECLFSAGSTTGDEPITETTRDWMFMEAVDCFVGSCPDVELGKQLSYAIAEEMHLSKERADHYLSANVPPLDENDRVFSIGRAQLAKRRGSHLQKPKRPFASTAHAKKLLEQIAVSVRLEEPVLLVGETGIGKTTVVQQLAVSLGHKLIAVNLSQQSEVGDLLGGFKPVSVRTLAVPLKEEFEDLFAATGISASKNQKYLEQIGKCFAKSQWSKLSKLWKEAPKMFSKIIAELERVQAQQLIETKDDAAQPTKKRKTQSRLQLLLELQPRWDFFARSLEQFDVQISGGSGAFAFSFVEGNLIKAVRNGDWVLLDEINLASPDTLESIADLLTGPSERPSILLSETGEIEKIVAHPDFRLFGAMNPATDVGKRDLPVGIRSRFTEIYVKSPDNDLKDLLNIIKTYMGNSSTKNDQAADDIARLYLNTKRMAEEKRIVDGANEVPHFSLRTLTRVLSYVSTIAPLYGVRRALYEGFSMGFLTLLDANSEKMLLPLIYHHLLDKHGNSQSLLSQPPKRPEDGRQYVKFQNNNRDRHYWLFQGNEVPSEREDYIITPYVERNLLNLVRATSTRRFPILIQGPTSAGKTSMIEYLANFTGNKFVRINNHEHTDLQEYLGTYVSGQDGKLRFQEGLLVQAMRKGHWIVLDELNLAPTDVLEALNRLLDDNRELLIPETQEVVRPHENFILFATQNPPGLYGGRKVLSRAFRNRFLELHFDDIPEDELEYILQQRSRNTSPPDCRRIVTVYKELSRLRQTSRLFEQKDSFATLRDLFRWALRDADTREEIAAHGFMLLAERVRNDEERAAVKEVIEKVFKLKLDPQELYSAVKAPELIQFTRGTNAQGVVWTHAMRRLYVLVSRALKNNEPVLLVGETGCGKTTVCQLLSEALRIPLHIVNAHQNTETGDLIGSQRPVRNRGAAHEALDEDLREALEALGMGVPDTVDAKLDAYRGVDQAAKEKVPKALRDRIISNETRSKALFEWSDGALVEAMRGGQFFLLDEISLADDSVLERLNSVLEPQRTLLLAEKGIDDSFVVAAEGFQFFATMNPGGDFGKKELSPALRNRFTEIWVPALSESEDIYDIVRTKLVENSKHMVDAMVDFASWFAATFRSTASSAFSVREILAWVQFVNAFSDRDPTKAFLHGASAIFVDSIGANPSAMLATDLKTINEQRHDCILKLGQLIGTDVSKLYNVEPQLAISDDLLTIGEFNTPRFSSGTADPTFAFHAPTTRLNAMRVVRALQMQKPILLEGSPGVGKTTLVAALAQACGMPLTRINLSDQTDLMDLFGTDVPVEGEAAGNFAWRDAPFLQAMQKGEWVLLDEMNLASQSVLEGLNACLDHRGEVYISELDQVFKRHPSFRLFAAQNPHHQGGGRKGLPSSFVNRFIVVYADVFKDDDLRLIASHNFPHLSSEVVANLISFISDLERQIVVDKRLGAQGGPWEFNLRDVLRWLHLLSSTDPLLRTGRIDDFLNIVVKQRFRTQYDRDQVDQLFTEVMGCEPRQHSLYHDLNARYGQVGFALLARNLNLQLEKLPNIDLVPRLSEVESIMVCVKQNIPCVLSAPSGFGKSSLLRYVGALAGKPLVVFPMNADIDTMDLVGGFEQADPLREVNAALEDLRDYLQTSIMSLIPAVAPPEALILLHVLYKNSGDNDSLDVILAAVDGLMQQVPVDSEMGTALQKTKKLLQGPLVLENPRFEWLDGVIVKALQTGQWLVLDNANMCNASVLDRLNSLLEPNGSLSINEHCDAEGNPRIVRPHPDFRIFLTMDPRYGELSRAMRNRAIEVHIHSPPPPSESCLERVSAIESCLQRFSSVNGQADGDGHVHNSVSHIQPGCLSLNDLSLLPRFGSESIVMTMHDDNLWPPVQQLIEFLQDVSGSEYLRAVTHFLEKLPADAPIGMMNVQPLQALHNYPAVQLLQNESSAYWLSTRYEVSQRLFNIQKTIQHSHVRAQSAKLGSLSRLQRSLVSDRVAAVSKDSTVKLGAFLSTSIATIREYLRTGSEPATESGDAAFARTRLLEMLSLYLERTISLSSTDRFDEAYFQAHISVGSKTLAQFSQGLAQSIDVDFILNFAELLENSFSSGFQLSTGLSMEVLWNAFRPIPIASEAEFNRYSEVDRLATKFDILRWKTAASVADLSKAQQTLGRAAHIVRMGSGSTERLVTELATAIQDLEAGLVSDAQDTVPFFSDEFDHLRQLSLLRKISRNALPPRAETELITLSNIPTKAIMMLASSSDQGSVIHSLDYLTHNNTYPWNGKLTTSVWAKLNNMRNVNLNSLALLETELPMIGHHVARLTADIASDPLRDVNNLLWILIEELFAAHQHQLKEKLNSVRSQLHTGGASSAELLAEFLTDIESAHLRVISEKHILPSALALCAIEAEPGRATTLSALAWLQFSIGTAKLYVPDKIFDPQLLPRVTLDFFKRLEASLMERKDALQTFQRQFTGQSWSALIDRLEKQLDGLGSPPKEISPVFRPVRSELSQLHAEFSNVLKTIASPNLSAVVEALGSGASDSTQDDLQLIKDNVSRLIDRLSARYEAYQDMTRPAVNLLRCLLVGVSLCDAISATHLSKDTASLAFATPFVGIGGRETSLDNTAAKSFEFLSLMSAEIAVHGLDSLSTTYRNAVFECFHSFFDDWKKKLDQDSKAEQAKSSLYRFRGSFEDEEEIDAMEFNELFPTFDEDSPELRKDGNPDQVRSISLRAAKAHRKVFAEQMAPGEALREACIAMGQRISEEMQGQEFVDRTINEKILPGALLVLAEKIDELKSASSAKSYNFYVDANITEARQLVSLARRIKARFRELQLVDEIGHMQPLADVIQSCDKLLEQVHGESLAKLLPKVEQLHAYVYEWQFGGWASKVYAVLALHDALTDTIIRWRRLELSTWANLFETEQNKCCDDAYSWWFIAYQVVIAVPLTMINSVPQLREYAASLVETVQTYFSSSIVGQFSTRVALLRQLVSHISFLALEYPALAIIRIAVSNFLQYYARYEAAASTAIQRGRAPIEKNMKDVLLMASWKDTNINALRESARKSHQKLFRIVRKFRAVLGQEMKSIIEQGLPDEQHGNSTPRNADLLAATAEVIDLSILNQALPGWLEAHRRLASVPKTVSVMQKIASSPEMSSNVAITLSDFVNELNDSMAGLRKETPSVFNDENKDEIKHLKTRKRKLFADTLRDLRNMGLSHNLSQDKLAEQSTLSAILPVLGEISGSSSTISKEAEYFLHKTFDLAPKARDAAREHSGDLTSAEVVRSVGFVEGLISFNMSQRRSLSGAIKSKTSLDAAILEFQALGNAPSIGKLANRRHQVDLHWLLPWLTNALDFAVRLVQVHGEIGSTDNTVVIESLSAWSTRFADYVNKFAKLGSLPPQLSSEAHNDLEETVLTNLDDFSEALSSIDSNRPDLTFILCHLRRWLRGESVPADPNAGATQLEELADSVSKLTDTVLVAIESARKKGRAVPREDGDLGWLTKHSEGFFSMISNLHMSAVEGSIRQCVQRLGQVALDSEPTSLSAMCIFSLASPILGQYAALCSASIEKGLELHNSTANMSYNLTKAFNQIASQGFCTPQEKSDEKSGDSGQLEAGTGLGDGDGAEDISKDIQDDEDLTELAQEANKEESGDVEDEKDAVDMADDELEGEMGSAAGGDDEEEGSQKDKEEEEENEMDEEAGDVDDLDPTAVDEKMWDGDDEKAEKDQQGNDATKGQQQEDDEQMAAEENSKKDQEQPKKQQQDPEASEEKDQDVEEEDTDAEHEDGQAREELNRQDQNVEEQEALELPEDMELNLDDDADDASSGDDDLNDLSDMEQEDGQAEDQAGEQDPESETPEDATAQQLQDEAIAGEEEEISEGENEEEDEEAAVGPDEVKDEVDSEMDEDVDQPKEEEDGTQRQQDDNANADVDNAAPSDVKSGGQDQNADSMDLDDQFQAQAAQQDQGDLGDGAADQDTSAGNKGAASKSQDTVDKMERDDDSKESAKSDPFRKLGDALEKWHRQNAEIMDSKPEEVPSQQSANKTDTEQGRQEYQHLQDDNAAEDTQALGTADEDEVRPVDESMAIEDDEGPNGEEPTSNRMEEDAEDEKQDTVADKTELPESTEARDAEAKEPDAERSGVQTRQGTYNRETTPLEPDTDRHEEDEGPIEETSTQLSTTHISDEPRPVREYGECMQRWTELQAKSHALSLSLTSQLRLILTPSQSTKLSGSFRTGKRLNIKRIIPYIASSYKRDKIWMRRSIPTKRTYQILLCVDDSKSMGESSSGSLALESLVMVSRSLTMLEAGQVGVVGFGGDVFTAHELTDPFASDAGAKALQKFTFSQDRTDIALLIRETIDKFRAARQLGGGGSSDLWQLSLILSDGLTPSAAHDSIRRLLREAMEERIMIVFIIMDDRDKTKADSVLELKEAKFVKGPDGESKVVIERYLDAFPFQYYLIVHNLEDLPTALAGLLRTWFAEVTA